LSYLSQQKRNLLFNTSLLYNKRRNETKQQKRIIGAYIFPDDSGLAVFQLEHLSIMRNDVTVEAVFFINIVRERLKADPILSS